MVIPDNVTSIGAYAFYYCFSLTGDLILSDNITSIGAHAFYDLGCTGKLKLPNNIERIEIGTFEIAHFTGTLTIPESVTFIGTDAFTHVKFTGSLIIPKNVTTIGEQAFLSYESSRSFVNGTLVIGESVNYIGSSAFKNCDFSCLQTTIDWTNVKTWASSFENCGFTKLIVDVKCLNSNIYNFIDEQELTSLEFTENVETISDEFYSGLTNLRGDLIIPKTVQYLGVKAFQNCGFDGNLIFSENSALTSISNYAFDGCVNFKGNLTIPNSIESIGIYAFQNCGFDGNLIFSDNSVLTSICNYAFNGCVNFKGNLTIPNSIESIGIYAFQNCGFDGELTLPNNSQFVTINNYAFNGCTNFTGDLTIPDSVTSIGKNAFNGCGFADGVFFIGKNVVSIDEDAFADCGFSCLYSSIDWTNVSSYASKCNFTKLIVDVACLNSNIYNFIDKQKLTSLEFTENVETISDEFYSGLTNLRGDLKIPKTVQYLGIKAFQNCGFDGNLIFSDNSVLTSISNYAFNGCVNFKGNLTIPSCIESIGDYAFQKCGFDGKLTLPDNSQFQTISDYAFCECKKLSGTLNIPQNVITIGSHAFYYCGFSGLTFSDNSLLTTIKEAAFDTCNNFRGDLTIPNSVTSIGGFAFYSCDFYGKLTLPDNSQFKIIDEKVFCACYFTGILNIPQSVTSIGIDAFSACFEFSGLTFSDNSVLTSIGKEAFAHCKNLKGKLTIPDTVTSIGDNAFLNCGFDGELTLPNNSQFVKISNHAFDGCKFSGGLDIPQSVKSIGIYAFQNCKFDGELTFSGTVLSSIGQYAFNECVNFKGDLTIPNSVTSIGIYAFQKCGFDGSLTLPQNDKLTVISERCFSECKFIGSLAIPLSVNSIGNNAFTDNNFNGSLSIPTGVDSVGANAFTGCSDFCYMSVGYGINIDDTAFSDWTIYDSEGEKITEMNNLCGHVYAGTTSDMRQVDCTVTFDMGDGVTDVVSVVRGTAIFKPEDPVKEDDVIFVKWVIGDDDVSWPYTVFENVTMTAVWEPLYEMEFVDAETGKIRDSLFCANGDSFFLPSAVKEGLVLKAWKVGNEEYAPGTEYTVSTTEKITFTAVWEEEVVLYEMKFMDGDSAILESLFLESGTKFTLPSAIKDGYILIGWNDGSDDYLPGATYTVGNSNVTFTAKWEEIEVLYEMKFMDGDSAILESLFFESGKVFKLPSPDKEGYIFLGWNDGSGDYLPGATYTVGNSNVTFTAKWEEIEVLYEMKFIDEDGVKVMESFFLKEGTEFTLPSFSKDGYRFLGWNDGQGEILPVGYSYKVEGNVTFVAELVKLYTIEFKDGQTEIFDSVEYAIGDKISLPAYGKDGFKFNGWDDGQGNVFPAGYEYTVTGNATFLANCEPIAFECVLSFDAMGGSVTVPSEKVQIDSEYTFKAYSGTLLGYTFAGWSDGEKVYQAGYKYTVSEDVVFTAVWNPITYVIVFDGSKASGSMTPMTVQYGSTEMLKKCTFSKTNFEFAGWAVVEGSKVVRYADGEAILNLASKQDATVTLYAVWSPKVMNDIQPVEKGNSFVVELAGGSVLAISMFDLNGDEIYVSPDMYTIGNGTTSILFKEAFTSTLAAGDYKLYIMTSEGNTFVPFAIVESPGPIPPEPTPSEDGSPMGLIIGIVVALAALGGAGAYFFLRKK